MFSARGTEPLRPRNLADPPTRSTGKPPFLPTPDQTPNPKKALLEYFSKADSGSFPYDSENVEPLPDLSITPVSKITKTYQAAFSYNSLQVQKLQGLLRSTQAKKEAALAAAREVTVLQTQLRTAIEKEEEARGVIEREEARNQELRTVRTQAQATVLAETDSNTRLSREVAKVRSEVTTAESCITRANARIDRLKAVLNQYASGHADHKQTLSALETDLRKERLKKHELEKDLVQRKQTLQILKRDLILMEQRLSSADLAWRETEFRKKAALTDRQALQTRWSTELTNKRRNLDTVLLQEIDTWEYFEQNRAFCTKARVKIAEEEKRHWRMTTGLAFLCVLCFFFGLLVRFFPPIHSPIG